MANSVVGIYLNKNEGDIVAETLFSAMKNVDCLYVIDNGSTDQSRSIMDAYANLPNSPIEKIIVAPNASRQEVLNSLLKEIRASNKPENTWIQMFESDVMVLDTDVNVAIRDHAVSDLGVSWVTLNAVRENWEGVDTYPIWHTSMKELMPRAHFMEMMLYTFRPLPKLYFTLDTWRPWPNGFEAYTKDTVKVKSKSVFAPLLLHVGWRGPKHFYEKFRHTGWTFHPKYKEWRVDGPGSVARTVSFFNGVYNSQAKTFPASRRGWIEYRQG